MIRACAHTLGDSTALWLGRVASYEDGCYYPGGPGAQPHVLIQAVGIVRGEQALIDAEEDQRREQRDRHNRR